MNYYVKLVLFLERSILPDYFLSLDFGIINLQCCLDETQRYTRAFRLFGRS